MTSVCGVGDMIEGGGRAERGDGQAVFISYASEDAEATAQIGEALKSAGIGVWFDRSELRGGDAWDRQIHERIHNCRLFLAIISAHTEARDEGYFRREWKLAIDRTHDMAEHKTFLVPIAIDDTPERSASVPDKFRQVQWTRLPGGAATPAFVTRIRTLLGQHTADEVSSNAAASAARSPKDVVQATAMLRRSAIAWAAVLGLGLACFSGYQLWLTKRIQGAQPAASVAPAPTGLTIPDRSVAVLPFVDMSEKKDQEYFSDGLSEELIDHLTHNADLKVIARTSSFAFKGKNEDMRSIAKKLGVANLLEGSVRKAGSDLRITVQLIRASDGVHLWSETYDRKFTDIFKVQDEISTTVAKALNVALNTTGAVDAQPASHRPVNIEAYNQVLNGNYLFWRGNKGDDAKAVEHFQRALKLEPHYALAWAKLARVYAWQGASGELPAAEAKVKGLAAVQRALEMDPNCAEAHLAHGSILRLIVGDWAPANSAYERAAVLDPHGQVGDNARGIILFSKGIKSGRFDDYMDWARQRLERNPLDTDTIGDLAGAQQTLGHLDESAATFRKLLDLNPAFATGWQQYALTLLLMGKNSEALAAAERESDEASKLGALACVNWAMGRRAESDLALAALQLDFGDRSAYMIAAAHAYRGEADAGFAWLDRAYQQMKGSLEGLKTDPLFYKLRGDPRFNALLRKAKLAE